MFLVNGVMLQGRIAAFDLFCMLLERDGYVQLAYKHAVSTIQPASHVDLTDDGLTRMKARQMKVTATDLVDDDIEGEVTRGARALVRVPGYPRHAAARKILRRGWKKRRGLALAIGHRGGRELHHSHSRQAPGHAVRRRAGAAHRHRLRAA